MTYTQAVIIFVAIPVAFAIAHLLVGAVTSPVPGPTSRVKPEGSRRGRGSLQGTAPAISQSRSFVEECGACNGDGWLWSIGGHVFCAHCEAGNLWHAAHPESRTCCPILRDSSTREGEGTTDARCVRSVPAHLAPPSPGPWQEEAPTRDLPLRL